MTGKAKRKGHPRQRILLQLIAGMLILVSIVAVIITLNDQSSSERIVYLHRDEENDLNVFMVDTRTPGQVIQLTDQTTIIGKLSASSFHNIVVYITIENDGTPPEIEALNVDTGDIQSYGACSCSSVMIDTTGDWVAYDMVLPSSDLRSSEQTINILNLLTGEERKVAEFIIPAQSGNYMDIQWLNDSNQLVMRNRERIYFYEINSNHIINEIELDGMSYEANQLNGIDLHWLLFTEVDSSLHLESRVTTARIEFDSPHERFEDDNLVHRSDSLWLNNLEQFLIVEQWWNPAIPYDAFQLVRYNLDTQSGVILIESDAPTTIHALDVTADDSMLLYFMHNSVTSEAQHIIYNLVTGEQNAIAIDGYLAQWAGR